MWGEEMAAYTAHPLTFNAVKSKKRHVMGYAQFVSRETIFKHKGLFLPNGNLSLGRFLRLSSFLVISFFPFRFFSCFLLLLCCFFFLLATFLYFPFHLGVTMLIVDEVKTQVTTTARPYTNATTTASDFAKLIDDPIFSDFAINVEVFGVCEVLW